ncbi:MAG: YidB family protein [Pseudomonadota bacterium]
MGLLDVLNGMQNGPHGQPDPSKGGMSPMTMAILALLAYKAVKHIGGAQTAAPAGPKTIPGTTTANAGGGLGGLLGGLLAGGAAGSVLSGGLGDLMKQLQQGGHEETANSWVGSGPNKQISANDLANALGPDQINTISAQTGISKDVLLAELAKQLPEIINRLTPNGKLPTEHEASRMI